MRAEIAAADRAFAVRSAAGAWREAEEIDAGAEAAIAALYPDDRVRTSKIFRVLFFMFTWFGYSTASGFGLAFLAAAGMPWESAGFAVAQVVAGAAMLGAAEWLTGGMRLRRFGIEEACAWIGLGHLVGGGVWWLDRVLDPGFTSLLIAASWVTAGVATLLVWRWATPGMGAVAALAIFVALSQAPANHLLWLLVAGLLAWPLGALSIAAHVSPEHRKRFGEAFVVFVVMFYCAVHVAVLEARLFPLARWRGDDALGHSAREALAGTPLGALGISTSLAAMAAVPLVLLWLGMRRRFRPALVLGLLATLASAGSFADRLDLGPLWLVLLAGGAVLVGAAMLARRFFSGRPGSEWAGLTALGLAEDRQSLQTLEVIATLAAFSPAPRQVAAGVPEGTAFAGGNLEGGGGDFGGGGASAKF